MKALRLKASQQFEIAEVPVPEIGPNDVLIDVKATGICGSDVHGIDGSTGRRIPPMIMGHESAGIINRVGESVEGWAVGQRVTFDSTVYCQQCEFCQAGQVNLCNDRRVLGVSCGDYNQAGAFAEYVKIPAHILYPIPDSMTFEQAAFCEPVSVALHAVNRVPIKEGDVGVVVGAGIIGLLVVQALKIAGCNTVIAVDVDPYKLRIASQVGADILLDSDPQTAAKIVELTDGRGADVAMEVVGISATTQLAIDSLRKGGSLGCVGNIAPKIEFPLQSIVTRELSIYGSCAIQNEYPQAIELISSGKLLVDPLISATAPLEEGAQWFDRLYQNQEDLLKVILLP